MLFKRRYILIIIILIIIIALLNTNIYYTLRSYLIMYPYSRLKKSESLINKYDIKLKIPSGSYTKKKDWYPFMLYHNDYKGFSNYLNKDLSLTVVYNFGHFDLLEGFSSYYNENSPYYNAFYGAYIIRNNKNSENGFGFLDNGKIDTLEMGQLPKYDQTHLVLPSLGCPIKDATFENTIKKIEYNVNYVNIPNWTKVNSIIKTNSPIHKYQSKQKGYIQYGIFNKSYNGENFPKMILKGRIYAKYFEEYNLTIVLYMIAKDEKVLNKLDKNILSKSIIK
ncbi:MAG: hypothetical protein FH753_13970 [Firmicutes bacterium]|nr:hypothetical protein [Bacillota bacterium]